MTDSPTPSPAAETPEPLTRVRIVDVEIPFFSMVTLLLKVTLASIPAALILFVLSAVFVGVFSAVLGR